MESRNTESKREVPQTPETERPSGEMPAAAAVSETPRPREAAGPTSEVPVAAKPETAPRRKDELLLRIERTLEDGLRDTYFSLTESARKQFKENGEAAARLLREEASRRRMRPHHVDRVIAGWLKTIPDVNSDYLAQAVAIKARQVLRTRNESDAA